MIFGYIGMLFVGLSLGMMGGGGSILTVPILVYLFSVKPLQATGYSLFIVGLVALVGCIRYLQKGEINFSRGMSFAIPGLAGIWLSRAIIVPSLPVEIGTVFSITITKSILIMFVFAALMVVASFSMIRKSNERTEFQPQRNIIFLTLLGFIVSVITGFVGAGGGFLIVPSLALIGGLKMRSAVATSLFVITINSLFGFTTDLLQETYEVDWKFLMKVAIVALFGIILGIKASHQVSEKSLKKAFGIFILLAGTGIIIQQLLNA